MNKEQKKLTDQIEAKREEIDMDMETYLSKKNERNYNRVWRSINELIDLEIEIEGLCNQ